VPHPTVAPPVDAAREPVGSAALTRTPLFDIHLAAGAKLIEFAGFQMPAYYAGSAPVRSEHMAVREACGVFDVSHMGELEIAGEQAQTLLQRLLSNDVERLAVGGAQYSVMCSDEGGVLDDLIAYRLEEQRFLLVTNAANHGRDLQWARTQAGALGNGRSGPSGTEVFDRREDYAMFAVQGPSARAIVRSLADTELPGRMRIDTGALAGVQTLVCGSGYTGEDGVELLVSPDDAAVLWRALVEAGARPAGLAARDTLRLEACLPLYGNELTLERGPIEAGLGWCCHEKTGFIGAEKVRAVRAAGASEKLVAFTIEGPGIPRRRNPVLGGGEVSSGTLSPCLRVGIGMAYVPAARSDVGTLLQIDVRGRLRRAKVCRKPLVERHG
jgi:aminomethyltransferase